MKQYTISLINAIIWFIGTVTYSLDKQWIHSTFIILLVISIVMNVTVILTKKIIANKN